jgi:hypothetical protein
MDELTELFRWRAFRINNPNSTLSFQDWLKKRAYEDWRDRRDYGVTWDEYLQEHEDE